MTGQKGVIFLWSAIIGTLWVSTVICVLVIRSEANALIERARLTDPSITEHTALISGNGGLGKYLLIRLDGPVAEVFERCPGLIENAICMRLK